MKAGKNVKISKKVSSVKHANKKYTKMQRQGKLRPKGNKRKEINNNKKDKNIPKEKIEKVNETEMMEDMNEENDVLDMIEEEDIQFLNASRQNYSFLNQSLSTDQKNTKSSEDEEDYEKKPRSLQQAALKQTRPLLPFKSNQGLIQRSEEIESSEEEDIADESPALPDFSAKKESLEALTPAQLYANHQKKLSELKIKVATMSGTIIENPEKNTKLLKELRLLLDDSSIGLIGFKLVMSSLLEVFKDIIPGYQINVDTEDKNKRMKKETMTLSDYEQALLRNYKHYLKRLEQLLHGLRSKLQKSNATDALKRSSMILGETAVMCFCELLSTHSHFNFHKVIISLIVPLMAHESENVSDLCCNAVKSVFKSDKLGQVSLDIVKHITKLVKSKNFIVHPKVLQTFLSLKIKDANLNADEKKQKILSRKEWYRKFSRKERKFKKKMASLDKELLEAEAEESKQKKTTFHTETVKLVFLCYFRILKQTSKSELLSSVLEGLAKYAHLINIDFFDDLINVLFAHVDSGELTYRESLHCAKTVFTILSGQGEALNIDPQKFYSHLYSSSLELHAGETSADVQLLLECFELMVLQRRKKISLARILAFMKRLSSLSLQLQHNGILACLSYVRNFLMFNRQTDVLLDPDCSSGSGCFIADLPEPDHCNAQSTCLWELHLLNNHYHPEVRRFAKNILNGAPIQGNGHLPVELSKMSAKDLLKEYDTGDMSFNPAIPPLNMKTQRKSTKSNIGKEEEKAKLLLNEPMQF